MQVKVAQNTEMGGNRMDRVGAKKQEQRQGNTRPQFARYYLMRLGIGNELKRVALNPEFPY